jgi:hypothetical protein
MAKMEKSEAGLGSKGKKRFFALANRLSKAADPIERERVKKELARMTFDCARSGLGKRSRGR